ncbi:FAD-dependent oxidoreductase [Candidatus Woesearchaeota archaeon]|nr:FAD-dependent oxidoreductase [Candidatus Woesearchaeota archaeon]
MEKIVILGLGAAGFGAALAAKKQDRSAEITIIDEKDFGLMHQCGLPFTLEGKMPDFSGLKHDISAGKMGMNLLKSCTVKSIDFSKKTIDYKKEDKVQKISYTKLIIASGSKPFIPPIKTDNKIFTVHDLNSSEELSKSIKKGEKAVIIGAGAIGLETAAALKKKGMDVKVIDMLPSAFPKAIDPDISSILEEKLKEKGIMLELGKKVEEITEKAIVVAAAGVVPNIPFIEKSEIKTSKWGIEVSQKMQTSIKDVYAAGDCCSVSSLINNEKMPSQMANNAYKQGVIAGANAAGAKKSYPGILNTFTSLIGDIEIAAVGFNSYFAGRYGIKPIAGKAKGKVLPEWFAHSSEELAVKLIADEKGKVIGAQAIGPGAKERINIVSASIKAGFNLRDIADLELAYCPALSDYYDVLVRAAELGLRKIR